MTFHGLLPRRWRADDGGGFTSLQRAMNDLFADFAPALDMPFVPESSGGRTAWFPKLDVTETERDYTVTAELPGLDPHDVEVNVMGDTLTIRGDKKLERDQQDGGTVHRSERAYGAFQRVLQLPQEVDISKSDARFDKGVLTVVLAKAAQAEPESTRLQIRSTEGNGRRLQENPGEQRSPRGGREESGPEGETDARSRNRGKT